VQKEFNVKGAPAVTVIAVKRRPVRISNAAQTICSRVERLVLNAQQEHAIRLVVVMQPAQHINALLATDAILSQPLFAFALLLVLQTMMMVIIMIMVIMMVVITMVVIMMVVIMMVVIMMVVIVVMIVRVLIIVGMDWDLISEMEETHTIYQVAECSIVDVTFPFILHHIAVEEPVLILIAV